MKLNGATIGRIVATAALCGATLGMVGCGGGGAGASDGQALYESKCTECHDLSVVDGAAANYTNEAEWGEMVKSMQTQSTNISDDDAAAITAYLASK